MQGRKKGLSSILMANSFPDIEYDPFMVFPNAVTSKFPVEASPEKLPPCPCTPVLALFNTSSAEPVNGNLKLHDIIKIKVNRAIGIIALLEIFPDVHEFWIAGQIRTVADLKPQNYIHTSVFYLGDEINEYGD
jgi:hypothetical protein